LPVCLFGFLGPGKREVKDFAWFFCLFKDLKSFEQNLALTFSVSHLSYRPSIRIFNGGCPRNSYSPMEFPRWAENESGETGFF
jgi:hypothetical protein